MLLGWFIIHGIRCSSNEYQRLEQVLFANYDPLVPPVTKQNASALDYANLKSFVDFECASYNESIILKSKRMKLSNMPELERQLQADNRIALGFGDFYTDGDLDDFDEDLLHKLNPNFDACGQWNEYRDAYLERHFEESNAYWRQFFHQYRNMNEWHSNFEDDAERANALQHHNSQVNAVKKCRHIIPAIYEQIEQLSLSTPTERENTITVLGNIDDDDLFSMALMSKLTFYSKYKTKRFWYINPGNGGDIFVRSHLPPELCRRHLTTNLALEMKQRTQYDFVRLYHDPEISKFSTLSQNRRSTTSQFVSRPVRVELLPSIFSTQISEANANVVVNVVSSWFDKRMAWKSDDFDGVTTTRTSQRPWLPKLTCCKVNCEEKENVQIDQYGVVTASNDYQSSGKLVKRLVLYPYEVMQFNFELSAVDSFETVELRIKQISAGKWLWDSEMFDKLYYADDKWMLKSIYYDVERRDQSKRYVLVFRAIWAQKMNLSTYSIMPILLFILLAPVGLLLPLGLKETLSFLSTYLLTVMTQMNHVRQNIPLLFEVIPQLNLYYSIVLYAIGFEILVVTLTNFLYYIEPAEAGNYSKWAANVSIALAKTHNLFMCRLWKITIPDVVKRVADHAKKPVSEFFDVDDLRGFRFLALVINRIAFFIVCIGNTVLLTVFLTQWVTPTMSKDNYDDYLKEIIMHDFQQK